jgi:hypothetical protein
MKRTLAILATLAIALFSSGCIVMSVHPYYTDDQLVFEDSLVGRWQSLNGKDTWEFAPDKDKHYLVTIAEDKVIGVMDGSFFRIDTFTFMDMFPWDFDYTVKDSKIPNIGEEGLWWNNIHLLPTHSVIRLVKTSMDTLQLGLLDIDWMNKQLNEKPTLIKHEYPDSKDDNIMGETDPVLLTASTKELQAFIRKYAADEGAFSLETFVRVKQ